MGFFNGFRTAHSGVIVIVFVDKFVEDMERLLTFFLGGIIYILLH